jgi:hypothetical protein
VDYNIAKLPKFLRCLVVMRLPCHFTHYALPSLDSGLCSFECGLADSVREAVNDGWRVVTKNNAAAKE